MAKGNITLSIDSNIIELSRIKRREDDTFNLSLEVERYLNELFETDLEGLEEKKLMSEKMQLQKRLAVIKAQEEALKSLEEKQKKEYEKEHGKRVVLGEDGFPIE